LLDRRPELLSRLARIAGRVTLLHVIRNPFDNIATMSKRSARPLDRAADDYFTRCSKVEVMRSGSVDVIDLRHEELVADPRATVASVCADLDLPFEADYIDACASIVYASPHRSRLEVEWQPALIGSIQRRIDEHAFLAGYSFET